MNLQVGCVNVSLFKSYFFLILMNKFIYLPNLVLFCLMIMMTADWKD